MVELFEKMKITLIVPIAEQGYTDLRHVVTLREVTDTARAVGENGDARHGCIQSSGCIITYGTASSLLFMSAHARNLGIASFFRQNNINER